jgi:hypothetical protein
MLRYSSLGQQTRSVHTRAAAAVSRDASGKASRLIGRASGSVRKATNTRRLSEQAEEKSQKMGRDE